MNTATILQFPIRKPRLPDGAGIVIAAIVAAIFFWWPLAWWFLP